VAGEHVELYELYNNRPLGEFVLRRHIGGVAFGAALQLGIGLDDGDGNIVDLALGDTFRTEPHPGRGRNTWRLENKADIAAIRGVIAIHQAGGKAVASLVKRDKGGERSAGGGRAGCIAGCVGVLSLLGVLLAFTVLVLAVVWMARSSGIWVPSF
jgi:hypothetical protein